MTSDAVRALVKRAMAGFAVPALDHLICLVKRKLKNMQHRPCLIGGCLAAASLTLEAW